MKRFNILFSRADGSLMRHIVKADTLNDAHQRILRAYPNELPHFISADKSYNTKGLEA